MKNAKKILALLLCAVLLVCATIAGTVAYLTQKTKTVENSFTVGKVSLGTDQDGDGIVEGGLDETDVDEYGVKDGDTRVTENTYKLIPGHTYVKDPTIHVAEGSEKCWLFVEVVNGIEDIEADSTAANAEKPYKNIADQMAANGWTHLSGDIYYQEAAATTSAAKDYIVFKEFKVADNADVSTLAGENGKVSATITVTAYAVQADGFTSAADAWGKTFGATTNP